MNIKTNNILVFGISGMLGSMVWRYLNSNPNFNMFGTVRTIDEKLINKDKVTTFDASSNVTNQLELIIKRFQPDYIINCIGIIKPYCKIDNQRGVINAIKINSEFPFVLSDCLLKANKNSKILNIATDCVFDGEVGGYNEDSLHNPLDVYGKTKSLGEVREQNFLNLRCSIIGPEIKGKTSLMEWFLSNNDGESVDGYTNHFWNGVTTLQFAKKCEAIVTNKSFNDLRKINHTLHWIENETVSKYDLLNIFNHVFNRDILIKKAGDNIKPIDRTLKSNLLPENKRPMKEVIKDLKNYIDSVDYYAK